MRAYTLFETEVNMSVCVICSASHKVEVRLVDCSSFVISENAVRIAHTTEKTTIAAEFVSRG